MNGVRQWIYTLLTLLISLSLVGCGIVPYPSASTPSQTNEYKANLNITLFTDQALFLQDAAEKYSTLHPNVTFSFSTLKKDESYQPSLTKQLNQNQFPDAFMVAGKNDILYFFNYLEPNPFPTLNASLKGSIQDPVTIHNTSFAFPLNIQAYGMLYNTQLLASLNLTTEQLSNISGLQSAIKTMQDKLPETGFQTPICCKTDLANNVLTDALNHTDTSQNIQINDSVSLLLQMVGPGNPDNPAVQLAKRQAGLYLGGSDILSQIFEIDPTAQDVLSIAPLPLQNSANTLTLYSDYLAVNQMSSQVKKQVLEDFASWLYQSEKGQKVLSQHSILSPYHHSGLPRILQSILQSYEEDKNTPSKAGEAPPGYIENTLTPLLEAYRTGQTDWQSCAAKIEESWKESYRNES